MSATGRVARAQRALGLMTVARAALWGLALAVVLRVIGLPAPALTATVVGIVSAFLWHGRAVWSRRSVALLETPNFSPRGPPDLPCSL